MTNAVTIILQLAFGALTAFYLGPALGEILHVSITVSGFLAGLFGLAILRKALDLL